MREGFPAYSKAAQTGDRGIEIVSKIINERFGWLFKRNHQEHDFGIDAQVDIISEIICVTGQMIALQIKCGETFLTETNQWGYVFRGEKKHFNYLANYPIPVLIVICCPKSEKCYWVRFTPKDTSPAGENWKITIPFENDLSESKDRILDLVPAPIDALAAIKDYWAENKVLVSADMFIFSIDRHDVEALSTAEVRKFFNRLRASKEIALHCQGKVWLSFGGYEDDPRELFQIPEVRNYIPWLLKALPELFFFVYTGERTQTLKTIALCLSDSKIKVRMPDEKMLYVEISPPVIAEILDSHFPGLNEMTDWVGMSIEENKRISFAVMRAFGIEIPDWLGNT